MKTILAILLTIPILAQTTIEPPRILGVRFDRANGPSATLFIHHPTVLLVQVEQVSDGRTNKIVTIIPDKMPIEWTVKLGGETNVFRVRGLSHHEPPVVGDWSVALTAIPEPKE